MCVTRLWSGVNSGYQEIHVSCLHIWRGAACQVHRCVELNQVDFLSCMCVCQTSAGCIRVCRCFDSFVSEPAVLFVYCVGFVCFYTAVNSKK